MIMNSVYTRMELYVLSGLFVLTFSVILAGCGGSGSQLQLSGDFESGNLPAVRQLDDQGMAFELALRDDNNDASLPDSFRTWWYLRADHIPVQKNLHLEFTRLGFSYYFVPVYSYDGKNWQYFEEQEVQLVPGCDVAVPDTCRLIVNKKFDAPTVWIARTFPYTTKDLSNFLTSVSPSPYVQIETLGYSPYLQKPLQLITIEDNKVPSPNSPRQTIWIHARTHAAETGPSFLLEGLIAAALADDSIGQALRRQYIFKIVPMHNIDGVMLGNYRTNATSINLENQWLFDFGALYLNGAAPLENRLVNAAGMVPAVLNQNAPVALALNLHSSNSDPDTAAFFFPHFGSDPTIYPAAQQNLWNKQLTFIKSVAGFYDGRIERPPVDGGAGFLNSFYPETWWWANKADAVNAMTLETTYGRAGYDHWITENDLRNLGKAVAMAIAEMNSMGSVMTQDDMSIFRLPFKPEIYLEYDLH